LKVCDKHNDRKAVDALHLLSDDTYVDVCDECKYAVMNYLSGVAKEMPKDKKSFVQKLIGQ